MKNIIYTFDDFYGNEVNLTFSNPFFSNYAKHVWVVCLIGEKWLLTDHPLRGYEFPGGKVEKGEHSRDAAIREVYEETGAVIDELHFVGQYKVSQREENIIKDIYFAKIDMLHAVPNYYETNGPILIPSLPKNIQKNKQYSFIMKDKVLPLTINFIKDQFM